MKEIENGQEGGVPEGDSDDSQGSTWSVYREHKRKLVQLANTRARLKEVNQLNKSQAAELKKLNKKIKELEKKSGLKVVEEGPDTGDGQEEMPAATNAEEVAKGQGFKLFFWS